MLVGVNKAVLQFSRRVMLMCVLSSWCLR